MSTDTVSHKKSLKADLPVVRFRVTPSELRQLKTYVAKNNTTVQQFCYRLIFSYLAADEGRP